MHDFQRIDEVLRYFHKPSSYELKKCPVHLHLSWLGVVLSWFEKQVASAVQRCYSFVKPHVVLLLDDFCLQPKRMCCLLCSRAMLYMNFRATVIVGMWDAHPNDCKRESSSTFPNLSRQVNILKIVQRSIAHAN